MKKAKYLVTTIVILSILVVGLGGYIAYDKLIVKDTVKTETEKKNNNNEKTTSQVAEEKENSKDCSTTVRCYGTYYVNGDINDLKYVLNEDGTYKVEGKEDFGVFTINENTITFLQKKHTVGPREEDPYYENPKSYLISDDCSKIRLTSSGSEISAELVKIN